MPIQGRCTGISESPPGHRSADRLRRWCSGTILRDYTFGVEAARKGQRPFGWALDLGELEGPRRTAQPYLRCCARYLFISNMVTLSLPKIGLSLASARISRRFLGF
jgi:hypothetical protein